MLSRRTLLGLTAGFLLQSGLPAALARAYSKGEPSAFIEELGTAAIRMVTDETKSAEAKRTEFRDLLGRGFALNAIARFVMGRYWRQASAEQRRRYRDLFVEYLVASYSARFDEYAGETFTVTDESEEGESGAKVTTRVMRPGRQSVVVQWHVREHKNQFKIVDVVIEGISMSLTQRSDFAATIRSKGGDIDAFLDSLEQKVAISQ